MSHPTILSVGDTLTKRERENARRTDLYVELDAIIKSLNVAAGRLDGLAYEHEFAGSAYDAIDRVVVALRHKRDELI